MLKEKFLIDPEHQQELEARFEFLDKLKRKPFILSDCGIPVKHFFDWRQQKILPPSLEKIKSDKRQRLVFSFSEFLWLQILRDLREMGLSYETLRSFKTAFWKTHPLLNFIVPSLMDRIRIFALYFMKSGNNNLADSPEISQIKSEPESDFIREKYPVLMGMTFFYFEYLVFHSYFSGKQVRLLLRYDGVSFFQGIAEIEAVSARISSTGQGASLENIDMEDIYKKEFQMQPHVVIPLNHYLLKFIGNEKQKDLLKEIGLVNENEQELLDVIRKKNLKELTVKFDQATKKMESYETKYDGDLNPEQSARIREILALRDYEAINYKSKNNKTVYFEKSIKRRFKNE